MNKLSKKDVFKYATFARNLDGQENVIRVGAINYLIDQLDEPAPQLSGKDKLRERVLDLYYEGADLNRIRHYNSALTKVIMLINDLDEPEITEHEAWEKIMREHHYHISPSYVEEYKKAIQDGVIPSNLNKIKPVVPQFVADFIEDEKKGNNDLWDVINDLETGAEWCLSTKTYDWIYPKKGTAELNTHRQILFIKAWLNDYEIEKISHWVVSTGNCNYFVDFFDRLEPHIVFGTPKSGDEIMKFTDLKQAELVAELIDGTVEEVQG